MGSDRRPHLESSVPVRLTPFPIGGPPQGSTRLYSKLCSQTPAVADRYSYPPPMDGLISTPVPKVSRCGSPVTLHVGGAIDIVQMFRLSARAAENTIRLPVASQAAGSPAEERPKGKIIV